MSPPLVLLIEDDDDTRECIRDLLIAEGYAVEEAADAQRANARLEAEPMPDLLLVDLLMPGVSGTDFVKAVERNPRLHAIRIIVLTGARATDTSEIRYPLLRKPIDGDLLVETVTQYCPRPWAEEEARTDKHSIPPHDDPASARANAWRDETVIQSCTTCGARAQKRCTKCGEAFCKKCMLAGVDAGLREADGRCSNCWRAGLSL